MADKFDYDEEYFVIEHVHSRGNKLKTSPILSWTEAVSEYHFYVNQFGKDKIKLLRCMVKIEELDVL
jgi:hypothetical protein